MENAHPLKSLFAPPKTSLALPLSGIEVCISDSLTHLNSRLHLMHFEFVNPFKIISYVKLRHSASRKKLEEIRTIGIYDSVIYLAEQYNYYLLCNKVNMSIFINMAVQVSPGNFFFLPISAQVRCHHKHKSDRIQ